RLHRGWHRPPGGDRAERESRGFGTTLRSLGWEETSVLRVARPQLKDGRARRHQLAGPSAAGLLLRPSAGRRVQSPLTAERCFRPVETGTSAALERGSPGHATTDPRSEAATRYPGS